MRKWLRENPFWWPWLFMFVALLFAYAMHEQGVNPADVKKLLDDVLMPAAALLLAFGGTVAFLLLFLRK